MELTGVEALLVPVLKVLLLVVMGGGAVVVFRELIPMARGRSHVTAAPPDEEHA